MPKNTKHLPLSAKVAASHRAELIIQQCRYAPRDDSVPSQIWHDQRQAGFLAWLDQGGFAQRENTKENSGIAPLSSTPAGAV